MKSQLVSPTLLLCLGVGLSKKIKVISTDAGASLPAKDGRAEILNSSPGKYSSLTVCARFLTHHFSTHSDNYPFQTLLSYEKDSLLSSYVARPCDQFYQGQTSQLQSQNLPALSCQKFRLKAGLSGTFLANGCVFMACESWRGNI